MPCLYVHVEIKLDTINLNGDNVLQGYSFLLVIKQNDLTYISCKQLMPRVLRQMLVILFRASDILFRLESYSKYILRSNALFHSLPPPHW